MSDAPKVVLPGVVTNDQAFLRAIVERLDQTNAIMTDMCDLLCAVKEATDKLNGNLIDVETAVQQTKTVQVNFDVDKLATKLSDASFTTGNTSRLRRESKTVK